MSKPKVTDIEINRVYAVYCDEHGYVDTPKRHADAIKARREHFFRHHKGEVTA